MDYNKQAEEFLSKTKTKLTITKAEQQKSPLWAKEGEKHGINYTCTLENKNHKYTFDFWNSIDKAEKLETAKEAKARGIYSPEWFEIKDWCNKQASATVPSIIKDSREARSGQKMIISQAVHRNIVDTVEILITPSYYDILACLSPLYEDTLEEFCDAMGYDQDSKTAEKVYNSCIEQDRNLRKLFSHAEMELLAEIQ